MAIIDLAVQPISSTVVYSVLSLLFLLTAVFTFETTNLSVHAPYCEHSLVLKYGIVLPSIIYCIVLATLAVSTRRILDLYSPWMYILYTIQPFAVPCLLNVIYEICYLVHKKRSVNFCGLEFDQGHRVKILNSQTRSFVLRNLIRIASFALLVIGIVANFNIINDDQVKLANDDEEEDALVGRIGWWGLRPWHGQTQLLLALIPSIFLVFVSFYLSIILWRYGTNSSIVVHSSYINPWCSQFFGTLAMAVGQSFGESLYLYTSHLGFLMLIWSDIYLMRKEISVEIRETKEFEDFLQHVASLGNEVSIRNVLKPASNTLNIQDDDEIDVDGEGGGISQHTTQDVMVNISFHDPNLEDDNGDAVNAVQREEPTVDATHTTETISGLDVILPHEIKTVSTI